MAEINIRQLLDENGEIYYPQTHVLGVDGMPENLEDFDAGTVTEELNTINGEIDGVQYDVGNLQTRVEALQTAIASMPTVVDTGWLTLPLTPPAVAYSAGETPQYKVIKMNNIRILSIRGAIKGITNIGPVAKLPTSISTYVLEPVPYVQNGSIVTNPTFTRMRIESNGDIDLERFSGGTPTATQWFPINVTTIL